MERITQAIKHLIIINVILFFVAELELIPNFRNTVALYFFENPRFHLWQFVTHMFMHAGVTHILFNMYALWVFGTPMEHIWGRNKFLFFYFSCGIGAALIHMGVNYYYFNEGFQMLVNNGFNSESVKQTLSEGKYMINWKDVLPNNTFTDMMTAYTVSAVGASGAIYGVLVAFAMMFPEAKLMLLFLPIPIKAKYFIPILVGIDLFSGVTGFSIFGANVAHFAHVGGALIGFLMMRYWQKNSFNKNRWD